MDHRQIVLLRGNQIQNVPADQPLVQRMAIDTSDTQGVCQLLGIFLWDRYHDNSLSESSSAKWAFGKIIIKYFFASSSLCFISSIQLR